MSDDSIIKNSSMLLAYLGGLGWGSAYFMAGASPRTMVSRGGM